MNDYLGIENFYDGQDAMRLIFRLAFMLVFVGIVIRSHSRRYHGSDHVFTYWLFSIVTFSIAFLLRKVPMELGFALGLFAVFGVLRYRTESIAIKDLTHLFVVIGLSLINALSNKKISFVELLIVNCTITGAVWLLESFKTARKEAFARIVYDKVALLDPARHDDLLRDLKERTQLPLTRFVIEEIDLLRDTVEIIVFFDAGPKYRPVSPDIAGR
jgi:Domain of unknown function (DUF4956)